MQDLGRSPEAASNTPSCQQRRFTQNSSGQSKCRLTVITVSTAERTLHPARMFTESLTARPELETAKTPIGH